MSEETGQIVRISERVMNQAAHQIAQWRAAGWDDVQVAINLAPQQIIGGGLVEQMKRLLAEHAIPAACLQVEITECGLLEEVETARKTLQGLKHLGLSIAVDDFGTGYSSLAYLKRFPINYLKVDQSFVRNLPGGNEDRALSETVLAVAGALGLGVVAEGVETGA